MSLLRLKMFVVGAAMLCLTPAIATAEESALRLPVVAAADAGMKVDKLAQIDDVVAKGIERGEMPGCVVLVAHDGKVGFLKAYGDRVVEPTREAMTEDTIFDLASLTKPIATATSVLLLIEQGKLALDDPIAKHMPEFGEKGKDGITIRHLLTHQGGLIPDNALDDYAGGVDHFWQKICDLQPTAKPEEKFIYSDVGFIVLGELVKRVSGEDVAAFAAKHVYVPLQMTRTTYNPPADWAEQIAPTEKQDGEFLRGRVHDPRAQRMGGVAGHAGLFSNAEELAVYSQMLLGRGEHHGVRVLKPETVELMHTAHRVPGGGIRGLGWDMKSGYSSNRGEGMSDKAFGHGGFTGTSIWIDPERQLTVIFLSNRLHPDGKGNVNPIAGRIGAIAVQAVDESSTTRRTNKQSEPTLTGIDVLERESFARLKDRRVALVTNQTGVNRTGKSTIELLSRALDVKLVALFSPEHGIEGKLDIPKINDAQDKTTGLRVFSLYGATRRPSKESLQGVDTIIFDIQDIGARFYTYISTLGEVLQAASENNVSVMVLDRPNPIGGVEIGGPVLDHGAESFVGFHPIPLRHGMTIGELAMLYKKERNLDVQLDVVKLEGWRRGDLFDATGLLWINPSPNMRSLNAALLYPGIGLLETTNLSVGRGTDRPFEIIGAPWIDPVPLADALSASGLPGITFTPTYFVPESSKFAHERCGGLQMYIVDRKVFDPIRTGFEVATTLRRLYREQWEAKPYGRLLGSATVLDALLAGRGTEELMQLYQDELSEFRQRRQAVLLYHD